MPRRNYPKKRRFQRSKRARLHKRQAHYARMRRITAHCSHISFRWNRMGDPVYRRLLAKRIQWRKGDGVIHWADAKEPKMLMVVIGYTRDGLCKTQYVDKRQKRTVWKNGLKSLLDPRLFGINPHWANVADEYFGPIQDEWERVRRWNLRYGKGQAILTTSADGGFETVTSSSAYMCSDGTGRIRLVRGGEWMLRFVQALEVQS